MNKIFKEIMPQSRNTLIIWIGLVVVAFLFGWIINGGEAEVSHNHNHAEGDAGKTTIWTCSMHPNIQQPKSGKCPICGMDLIPVSSSGSESRGARELTLSEYARKLAEVEVAEVKRKAVTKQIRLLGKVEYDETRLSYITARFPGRIDKLHINFTGTAVKKGDRLIELYSPEILSTQRELIESYKTVNRYEGNSATEIFKNSKNQLSSIRERLRLWGLTEKQISAIEKSSHPSEHISLYSTLSGVVIEKNAQEGMYVNTGTRIYSIADLSTVWVKMDAYESDLAWIKEGQNVEFTTEAYPGQSFIGQVSFIDPILNEKTRTVKVRVGVENKNGKLKPGMFVHAIIKSQVGEFHKKTPLIIPASAPLITGTRAVVYVEVGGKEGTYEGKEIELGPRTGDYYIVKSGLTEGERVVVKGSFKIDSAIQIQAKPSMMNPEGGGISSAHHHHGETHKQEEEQNHEKINVSAEIPLAFRQQLDNVYSYYFDVQYSLSHDQFEPAIKQIAKMQHALKKVDMALLDGEIHMKWMEFLNTMNSAAKQLAKAEDMENVRVAFDPLSEAIIKTAKIFRSDKQNLLVFHCPMAFNDRGANWLQNKTGVENPYFGSMMFSCGEQTGDLTPTEVKNNK
ncbi:efflux RND transporter periplasmic adaptor subunit [candidate division KSB1 bacterium]|nr:efflux RND transporter periplasmic adaptor subunit [candidate division KSB1 bacterium]MBL7093860.1 efflux RND transporter periplasmic adaptor subunit [candidate division KSB1 bacterium]